MLQMHSRSHNFPMPKCFHGIEATFLLTRDRRGATMDYVNFICGHHGKGNECKFRIDVNRLLSDSVSLTCARYSMKDTGECPSSHLVYEI